MIRPALIPLFPLPNVVLFPGMPLPLHIFEPRYRAMTRDAAAGDGLIGMVLLRGDWQSAYHGVAPTFDVGTAGEITELEELPDGRFNLVLRGTREFTIRREADRGTLYRQVEIDWRAAPTDVWPADERASTIELVRRFLGRRGEGADTDRRLVSDAPPEMFVNLLAQTLALPPVEQQSLLEAPSTTDRARRLRDVLAFHLAALDAQVVGDPERAH